MVRHRHTNIRGEQYYEDEKAENEKKKMGPKRVLDEMMRTQSQKTKRKVKTTSLLCLYDFYYQFLISLLCAAHACDHTYIYAYKAHTMMMMMTTSLF